MSGLVRRADVEGLELSIDRLLILRNRYELRRKAALKAGGERADGGCRLLHLREAARVRERVYWDVINDIDRDVLFLRKKIKKLDSGL